MKATVTIVLCLLIIGGGVAASIVFDFFKPEAKKLERTEIPKKVDVFEVAISNETIKVRSQGVVEPVRSSQIAAEVSGKIIDVNPALEVGAVFKPTDVLMRVEGADYSSLWRESLARVADAELTLKMEKARAEQAIRDWQKLGGNKEPSDLVKRIPQLKSAEAKLGAAQAAEQKAQRDVDRTVVSPPYLSRIEKKYVEEGGFVAIGSPLVDIDSSGQFEIRLPVSLDDFSFLPAIEKNAGPKVDFSATIAGSHYKWQGKILRTEGEVDRGSRSIYLVASIGPVTEGADSENLRADETSGVAADRFLSAGLFVQATITGSNVKGLAWIPRKAMHTRDTVLVVGKDAGISFRKVTVAREEERFVFVSDGLKEGDRIVVTPLGAAINKMKVQIERTRKRKELEANNGD